MSERQIQCRDGQLLAVTTRSRLRSARLFPAMLLATWAIRRQLARTDGLVRWASLVAGPTEFWTITVWRSRHAMQEFMRSDAHGRIMWRYTRWLDGLWLMRWRPGAVEVGSWDGVTLASPAQQRPGPVVGPGGGARDPSARYARRPAAQVRGAHATVIRIRAPALQTPSLLVGLLRLRRRLAADPDLLRSVVGLGSPGEVCFLGIWRAGDRAAGLVDDEWVRRTASRWAGGFWASQWLPEHEFGHWDGLRLRRRRRGALDPPPAVD
jgi:hypothetical protein